VKLHQFHARRLESTLGLADGAITRMENLLAREEKGGAVRTVNDTLAPETRSALLQKLQSLRNVMLEMASALSLAQSVLDIRQVLAAEISTLWVIFEDCRPAKMKGYGQPFEPKARTTIEQHVERILNTIHELRAIVQ